MFRDFEALEAQPLAGLRSAWCSQGPIAETQEALGGFVVLYCNFRSLPFLRV